MAMPPIYQRRRSRRVMVLTLSVIILALGFWGTGFYQFAQKVMPNKVEDLSTKTDAIVVLTGGSGRLDVGLSLLRNEFSERLFISGVYQGIDVNQLLKMSRENPEQLASRVEIGNAVDTSGNAIESALWAEQEGVMSIRLVTAAYHMPRSLQEFSYRMPGVVVIPHPVFPPHVKEDWWLWPGTTWLVLKEYNKFLVVWWRQQTALLFGNPRQISNRVFNSDT